MVKIQTVVIHDGPAGTQGPAGTNIYVQPGDPGSVPDGTLWLDTDDTTPDTSLNWGDIAGTLSSQTDLNTALAAKAPLASPALTGTPTAPTPTVGDNSTKLATTAFVAANAAGNPLTTKGDLYGYSTTGARVPVGANGQALVADSTQATGLSWITPARYGDWVIGLYLTPGMGPVLASANADGGFTANELELVPIDVPFGATTDRMSVYVATAAPASSVARLGIFTAVIGGFTPFNWTGVSVTRVLDCGTVTIDTTGVRPSGTLSQVLAPGRYWLGMATAASSGLWRGDSYIRAFGLPEGNFGLAPTNRGRISFTIPAGDISGGFAASYAPGTTGANEFGPRLGLRRSA